MIWYTPYKNRTFQFLNFGFQILEHQLCFSSSTGSHLNTELHVYFQSSDSGCSWTLKNAPSKLFWGVSGSTGAAEIVPLHQSDNADANTESARPYATSSLIIDTQLQQPAAPVTVTR